MGKNLALETVVEAWDLLPPEVQTEILKLVDKWLGQEKRCAS